MFFTLSKSSYTSKCIVNIVGMLSTKAKYAEWIR